ncbi:DUF1648 domain-containing protein [Flammeovirga sp. EKP202]|uniref:DUF1648 domain-containing protein n=1 Tax=Flammeovirga sp. EKP202 TaxID=2770592 RepID=UPI00165FFE74|nr:DUF1648 domain-containing protein [Flammeovirga sp. EKP202]MBD0400750.1 DUF1648 domain-containing protein [Flammeovirga sp. EKP202]
MKKQPKIKISLSLKDKTIELVCIAILLITWILPLAVYNDLPEEIAIHFNAEGIPDSYGPKSSLFGLPIFSLLLFLLLTILNKYPHTFNYPVEITEENAFNQYTLSTRFIRFLKLSILIVFLIIVYKSISLNPEGLGNFFLPFVLIITFAPIIIYLVKVMRSQKDE